MIDLTDEGVTCLLVVGNILAMATEITQSLLFHYQASVKSAISTPILSRPRPLDGTKGVSSSDSRQRLGVGGHVLGCCCTSSSFITDSYSRKINVGTYGCLL
jgi:hypothetical protein